MVAFKAWFGAGIVLTSFLLISEVFGGTFSAKKTVPPTDPTAPSVPTWAASVLKVASPLISQVVFFAPMDAMRKIRAEGTTGTMTAIPYSAMMASCAIWITYGLLAGDPTIWLPNVTGAMFGAYYLRTFARYAPMGVSLMQHYIAVASCFAAATLILISLPSSQAMPLVGYVGVGLVIVMFSGPLAVISTIIQTKNTSSLHPFFTAASFSNCLIWTCYGAFVIHDTFIWGPNLLGLVAACAQIALFVVYGLPPPSLPTHTAMKQLDA